MRILKEDFKWGNTDQCAGENIWKSDVRRPRKGRLERRKLCRIGFLEELHGSEG